MFDPFLPPLNDQGNATYTYYTSCIFLSASCVICAMYDVRWCWMNKHHTIPYHTIPYHTIPYHTIPYQCYNSVSLHLITLTQIGMMHQISWSFLRTRMMTDNGGSRSGFKAGGAWIISCQFPLLFPTKPACLCFHACMSPSDHIVYLLVCLHVILISIHVSSNNDLYCSDAGVSWAFETHFLLTGLTF